MTTAISNPDAGYPVSSDTTIWLLGSGKAGHEANVRGVGIALGGKPDFRPVTPRAFWGRLAPWGPVDPRDRPGAPGSSFGPPFPDIAIACGRVTVPYLHAIRKASCGRTFTAFLQDPRWRRSETDMIWVPAHDRLRGVNVIATLTSPHPVTRVALGAARQIPDSRLAGLRKPRVAMILGGPNGKFVFGDDERDRLVAIARQLLDQGYGVMVTPSRRTPQEIVSAISGVLSDRPGAFVWDGKGANPYIPMLALADAIIVTGDSVNMVGEAAATGAPVHVFEPGGDDPKTRRFLEQMVLNGAVRRWSGQIEAWVYDPVDATREIAQEIARRFVQFRAQRR